MQESSFIAGIDWATEVHAVCILGDDGRMIERFDVTHDNLALRMMVSRFRKARVTKVAIERGDGPVVQVLIDAGLAVFVAGVASDQSLTDPLRLGNKDDRLDAYVLADTLRTDGHRWRPLREDHPETKSLRAMCRACKDLVEIRVQVMNQLRSNLELAFPGALGLFSRLDSPITLAFLRRFPTAAQGAWLSPARLDRWLKSVGYTGGISAQTLYQHLDGAAPGLFGVEAQARGQITTVLVTTIETLTAEIIRIETQIRKLFDAHPDQKIFASLPRSGMVRAATLLAEIGDCRERFPSDDALAALAGASPSTRQSGKHEQTVFRWSCNKKLRRAVMDFANGSRLGDPWAMQVYRRAIARGCRHPRAIGDTRTRLDPHHLALLARRNPFQPATTREPKTPSCLT